MRIPLMCMQCFQEQGKPDEYLYPAELQDNGLYRITCRHGHETVTALQEQKFELLFDLGVNAIIDGYYREAVASFTSSMERFYEFYIQTISTKHNVSESKYIDGWKKVSSQSERQLGAYIFLYLNENGDLPPLLSDNKINFRNDVIHKGKLPTKYESLSYGQSVLDIVAPVLEYLKSNENAYISIVTGRYIHNLHTQIGGDQIQASMTTPTTLSLSRASTEPQPNLQATIESYESSRKKYGW